MSSGANNDTVALIHAMKLLRWSYYHEFLLALLIINFIDGVQDKPALNLFYFAQRGAILKTLEYFKK